MKNSSGNHDLFGVCLVVVSIFLYHGIPRVLFWSMARQKFVMMRFPGFWVRWSVSSK